MRDVADALAYALRFQGRERVHNADEIVPKTVSNRLMTHLERAAFEAFAQLALLHPDAELVITGGASLLDHDAYQRAFVERLATLGPAAASVRRLGVIADRDMPRLYCLASALVFASVKEGFGLCVLEGRRAAFRSSRRGSTRSSVIARRRTRCGATR